MSLLGRNSQSRPRFLSAVNRELPNNFPSIVIKYSIGTFVKVMESSVAITLRNRKEGTQHAHQVVDRRPILAVFPWPFEAANYVRLMYSEFLAEVPFRR